MGAPLTHYLFRQSILISTFRSWIETTRDKPADGEYLARWYSLSQKTSAKSHGIYDRDFLLDPLAFPFSAERLAPKRAFCISARLLSKRCSSVM
mmetsp:Transcript_20526/g.43009  ORF Transcript_20526/g.43009 Transcript_20526/m.43009 type:complete len:94 (+) Transcript_20526:191-472(+)